MLKIILPDGQNLKPRPPTPHFIPLLVSEFQFSHYKCPKKPIIICINIVYKSELLLMKEGSNQFGQENKFAQEFNKT